METILKILVVDDFTGTIAPWRMMTSDVESVKLLVAKEEAEKARQIIAEYQK